MLGLMALLTDVRVERDEDGALVVFWTSSDGTAIDVAVGTTPQPRSTDWWSRPRRRHRCDSTAPAPAGPTCR